MDYSPWVEKEIWPFLKGSNISETKETFLEFFEYNENDSDSSTSESASHTHQELEVSIYY